MRKTYQNINADLDLLAENISGFFKNKGFEATIEQLENGYQIHAQNSIQYKIKEPVSTVICGEPHNFFVELMSSKKDKGFRYPIILTTLIGGGFLIREKLRSEEELLRFEKDFWEYVDIAVNSLRNTFNASENKNEDVSNEN
jgi:hypothetical protein